VGYSSCFFFSPSQGPQPSLANTAIPAVPIHTSVPSTFSNFYECHYGLGHPPPRSRRLALPHDNLYWTARHLNPHFDNSSDAYHNPCALLSRLYPIVAPTAHATAVARQPPRSGRNLGYPDLPSPTTPSLPSLPPNSYVLSGSSSTLCFGGPGKRAGLIARRRHSAMMH
jgi:hypothetical protein